MLELSPVSSVRPVGAPTDRAPTDMRPGTNDPFTLLLGNALSSLNTLQQNADAAATALATGGDIDLHEVMIAQEQSSIAMQFTMQVRNRVVEAYQEIMRMQV